MAVISSDINLTAVSYIAGEDINVEQGATLTINATPSIRPGNITALVRGTIRVINSSTTTPLVLTLNSNTFDLIARQNGSLLFEGNWIIVHTGTGAAGQTINFSSIGGQLIDYPTLVEVEQTAGTGDYRPWYVVPGTGTTGATIYANLNEHGNQDLGYFCLYNETTRVLTFGNGINGNVIPSGCRVRIPNIHVTSAVNNNTLAQRSTIEVSAGAVGNFRNVSFSNAIYCHGLLNNFSFLRLENVGMIGRSGTIGQTSGRLEIFNAVSSLDPRATGLSGWNIANIASGSIDRLYGHCLNGTPISISSIFGIPVVDTVEGFLQGRSSGSQGGIVLTFIQNCVVSGLLEVGARLNISACSNLFISDAKISDTLTGQLTTAFAQTLLLVQTGSSNIVFDGISIAAGGSSCRNQLFTADATTNNITVKNVSINCQNHALGLALQGSVYNLFNINLTNLRTPPTLSTQAGQNLTAKLILGNQPTTAASQVSGSFYEFVRSNDISPLLPNYIDSNPFAVLVNDPASTGNLFVGAFGRKSQKDIYTISGLEGTDYYFDNNGKLFIISSGIVATFRSFYPLHSITSFQNVAPTITGDNIGSLTFEFRVANPGEISAAVWQSLTGSNLASALGALSDYDSDAGFDIEVRITSSGVDSNRSINLIKLATNNDAAYVPTVGTTLIRGNLLISGSIFAVFDNTAPASPVRLGAVTASGSVTAIEVPYNFDNTVIPFVANAYSYLHNIATAVGAYSVATIDNYYAQVLDSRISESNRSTVQAYSDLGALGRIYDSFKDFKTTIGNLSYPSISGLLATANGTILDLGSLNLIVDATAATVRSINKSTNTITIKASLLTASGGFSTIQTTGTITFANGADYAVTVVDSTGTRYPAVTISGFPTSNNSNGIAPAPRVAITNLRTAATQSYTVAGATIALKLSAVGALPDDDVRITVDAIGYKRPLDQAVKGSRIDAVPFIFEPWVNAKGQEIVGLEPATSIDYDFAEERLLLPSGAITFYGALHNWELVTAGPSFNLFPTNAVKEFDFIEGFDGSKRVVIGDPWTFAAKPDDASSPIITDFTVIAQTATRDPFEHGLPSTAPGLTDRPEIVIAFQAPTNNVTVTSITANAITAAAIAADAVTEIQAGLATQASVNALPSAIDTQLADNFAAIPVPPSASTIALAVESQLANEFATIPAAPSATDNATAVWGAATRSLTDKAGFSLSSTAEDSIVTKVWAATSRTLTSFGTLIADTVTAVWGAATRSLTDKAGFAPTAGDVATAVDAQLADNFAAIPAAPTASTIATAVWASADKTGYSLTPAERTAIATAVEAALINEGDGQQLIDAILDVINANLDLPLLELTAIAQAVRSELSTELGRIDTTISSRLASAGYTAPPSTSAIATAVWAAVDKTGYSLTTAERTAIATAVELALSDNFAAIPAAPPAGTIASAVRTELTTELGRIDTAVSSRSQFDAAITPVTVGAINANAITAASIASGAITAAKINTDAITAAKIAADAVTEIQAGLATSAQVSGLNNLSTGQVRSEVDAALTAYDPPTAAELTALINALPAAVDSQLADNFTAVLSAISALPAPNNTAIASILAKVDQITVTGGLVEATIGSQAVTLNSTQSEQLLKLYQLAGWDAANPADRAQNYHQVAGVRVNYSEPSPGVIRLTRVP